MTITHFILHCGFRITADGGLYKHGELVGQYRSMNQAMAAAEQLAKVQG